MWCLSFGTTFVRNVAVGAGCTTVFVLVLILQRRSEPFLGAVAENWTPRSTTRLLALVDATWQSAGVLVLAGAAGGAWGVLSVSGVSALARVWAVVSLTTPLAVYGWILGARGVHRSTLALWTVFTVWRVADADAVDKTSYGLGFVLGRALRVLLVDVFGHPLMAGLATAITLLTFLRGIRKAS